MTRILPVFSSVFPGPQMPWHTNSSLQLQDMYDQVYFHLIGMSHHRTTILQVLGQCLFSDVMDPDLKIIGSPASATSPKRIETRLGLERGTISRILAPIHVLLDLEPETETLSSMIRLSAVFCLNNQDHKSCFWT